MAKRGPNHPGEILKTEFLDELGLSAYALAQALHVPTNRVTGIVNGERAVTAETALRLARFFGTTQSSGSTSRRTTTSPWQRGATRTRASGKSSSSKLLPAESE
jgi:addiction module HigA family antidote